MLRQTCSGFKPDLANSTSKLKTSPASKPSGVALLVVLILVPAAALGQVAADGKHAAQAAQPNPNGDREQDWCAARQAGTPGAVVGTGQPAGRLAGNEHGTWTNIPLPQRTVLGKPDVYSCHTLHIPDAIPDVREVVGVRLDSPDASSHLHQLQLMECPADLWFLADATRSSDACIQHYAALMAACNRWWVGAETKDSLTCTPPGLIYARAGELRAANKVLVLQAHWVFRGELLDTAVTLANTSLSLLHQDPPPKGPPSHIMETLAAAAVYPSSTTHNANGLVIPAGQQAYRSSFSCAKRCTFVPLGGLSGKPVSIAGYTFQANRLATGARATIKRCPLTRLPDITWEVAGQQQPGGRWPTYDVTGQGIQLYPGDTLSWSCTYNTSGLNATVYGGHAAASDEQCNVLLHYSPRNTLLRGCSAVTREQGSHSLCMFEAAQMVQQTSSEADRLSMRAIMSPRTLPPGGVLGLLHGAPQGLNPGYKASIVLFWTLSLTAFLWGVSALLSSRSLLRHTCLAGVHGAYRTAPPGAQRTIAVYLMHICLDSVIAVGWFLQLFAGWCGCTEAAPSAGWSVGFFLLYLVASYTLELVWRLHVDPMLVCHHVATILFICILAGELAADLYMVTDTMFLLAFFALVEQPTFGALALHKLLPAGSHQTLRAWQVAVPFWFASKTFSVVLAAWLVVRDWQLMPGWVRGLYIGVWASVYCIQVWSGFIQLNILRSLRRRRSRNSASSQAGSSSGSVAAEASATLQGDLGRLCGPQAVAEGLGRKKGSVLSDGSSVGDCTEVDLGVEVEVMECDADMKKMV